MCVQVSFDQLNRLDAVKDTRFGISGLGPAGLIAVQMARSYGAEKVVAIDPVAERRELALDLGADVALPPDAEALQMPDPENWNWRDPSSYVLDAAIDCTGLKVSLEFLLDRTKEAVALFGVLRESAGFGFRQWLSGVALLGYGTHNRSAAERALHLILDGHLNLAPLVTHHLAMSQYAEGVELLRKKEAVKICFHPWDEI